MSNDITKEDNLAQVFKALGEPARMGILKLLPASDDCEDVYNVSELAEELGLSQPTVSHHLCVLKNAGLVQCRKMCRDKYYWLDRAALDEVLSRLGAFLEK